MIRNIALAALLTLAACSSKEEPKPAVTPLKLSGEIPALADGPHAIEVARDVPLTTRDGKWELELSVFAPKEAGTYPLILFSHGNWSDSDQYDNVIRHWVSRGYVVIAPDHQDCCGMAHGIWKALTVGNMGLITNRPAQLTAVLDNLDTVIASVPFLKGKIDREHIAATGHSFGAFTAQMMTGAAAVDLEKKTSEGGLDPRIDAVVAISPPGPMFDVINNQSWKTQTKPMLVTTGTWDTNAQFFPQWRLHAMSFDTAPATGNNRLLVVQGADHYLGRLICRLDREEAPQRDQLKIVNAVTAAFLDAHLKGDQAAAAFLDDVAKLPAATGGFATLERR